MSMESHCSRSPSNVKSGGPCHHAIIMPAFLSVSLLFTVTEQRLGPFLAKHTTFSAPKLAPRQVFLLRPWHKIGGLFSATQHDVSRRCRWGEQDPSARVETSCSHHQLRKRRESRRRRPCLSRSLSEAFPLPMSRPSHIDLGTPLLNRFLSRNSRQVQRPRLQDRLRWCIVERKRSCSRTILPPGIQLLMSNTSMSPRWVSFPCACLQRAQRCSRP